MSLDENELRKALDARSGELTPEYRARVRQAMSEATPATNNWMAVVAVLVVTALTATSVGVLVASRHGRTGSVASASRLTSPTPAVTPSPVTQATNVQLSAPSANVTWALVDYDSLFRSTDEGDHWEKRSLPSSFGVRPSISFINADEGWLLAPGVPETQCDVQLADLWHTTDGGATWQDLGARIDKSQCKNGIWFVDSTHGFVVASDENRRPTVYRTSDGGDHWAFSSLPDNPLFVTQGGGFTLHVNWIKAFGQTAYIQASGSQDDASWHDRDFIYVSRDGGATWTWKQKLGSSSTWIVTESRWLQLAPDIEESVNGGQAFGPYQTDLRVTPPLMAYFVDADHGYVVAGALVQGTSDGGAHWTHLSTPWNAGVVTPTPTPGPGIKPSFGQLSAPSMNEVWAYLDDSRLFFSPDQGKTWQERTLPSSPFSNGEYSQIAFVDANHGWMIAFVVGNRTAMWTTTDGARSWREISYRGLPVDERMPGPGFEFFDSAHGFITWQDAIYRTADGGLTWAAASLPDPPAASRHYSLGIDNLKSLDGIHFALADTGAGSLYVYRSTDFGATWNYLETIVAPGVGIPGTVVTFVTASRWLRFVGSPKPLETTDGGQTWHVYPSDYMQKGDVAHQVLFADAFVGYAWRGGLQQTTNGGAHWELIKTSWP